MTMPFEQSGTSGAQRLRWTLQEGQEKCLSRAILGLLCGNAYRLTRSAHNFCDSTKVVALDVIQRTYSTPIGVLTY